jgi:purine nucleosidase
MVGLDLTHQARATEDVVARIEALDSPVSTFVLAMLRSFDERMAAMGRATGPVAIHDACAVACALDPTLMPGRPAHVTVELRGEHTYGMTVTDFFCRTGEANAQVPERLDGERFWPLLVDCLRRVGGGVG